MYYSNTQLPYLPRNDREVTVDERLTSRERAVLTCLCEGMANKEIAMALGISQRTVESRAAAIVQGQRWESMQKTGAFDMIMF